jgi:hypothetical protein
MYRLAARLRFIEPQRASLVDQGPALLLFREPPTAGARSICTPHVVEAAALIRNPIWAHSDSTIGEISDVLLN